MDSKKGFEEGGSGSYTHPIPKFGVQRSSS
jgi:hypothetical protein